MRTLLKRIKVINLTLYYCGLAHLALLAVFIILSFVDYRELHGMNLWIKPIKFAISIAIYCLTWPLFLKYLPFDKLNRRFARFTAFAMTFEMVAIASQAARGELSHFNQHGVYNIIVYNLMGGIIVAQTLFALYMGIQFFKIKAGQLSSGMLWAIRLAIIIACIFALEGGVMGAKMSHTIDSADGGPGLPILNWSRIAGDLRIAHFAGLHSLQIIPLFVLVTNYRKSQPAIVFASIYFVIVSLLLFNALLGRPLI